MGYLVGKHFPHGGYLLRLHHLQCADKLCGLFTNGRAYTVSVSAVNWAVSGIPGVKTDE
jgi:hypothetical protein